MFDRVFLVVLDSLGIGHAADAADFGDEGANTLKSVMTADPKLPNLESLGLFNIKRAELEAEPCSAPKGIFGYAEELSRGKDTTVGHWEIAGLISEKPLPTYPNGFPEEVISAFCEANGVEILCNKPYSGTEVIKDYGEEHVKTGKPIVYTSADSVFQIAAHESVIPLPRLYELCESARKILCGEHAVGRVIARPFSDKNGEFYRTGGRHDYSLEPSGETMLDKLKSNGFDVISIGKINDIFAGHGITESNPTKNNQEGEALLLEMQKREFKGLCFVNLVDFDMVYGHRNDISGYARALEHFDETLGRFLGGMKESDLLIITADHGCDPGFRGTDHTRENIPLIIYSPNCIAQDIGGFESYACIAESVCRNFGIASDFSDQNFFEQIKK
ncbi:MAG: phosphopentomutase [Clostridia bacterium]|nr:phosphopentomutase [Clostridia bacterium]